LANKRQYGVFQALYMSFYSKELYQDVIENWKGIGFFYLCLVVILIGIPQAIQFQSQTNSFVQILDKPEVLAKIPSFQITNGAVSVTGDNPYYFPDPKFAMAIVDTTGQTTSLEGSTATILLTKDTLYYRDPKTKTLKTYPLKTIDFFELNQGVARAWLDIFRTYMGLVAYPFITAWTFLWRMLWVLLFGVTALIFASVEKFPMGFGTALRVAVVAQTPVLVLKTLLLLAIKPFPFMTLLLIVSTALFLWTMLKSSFSAAKAASAAAKA
jgi:hypothetical protein